ncbi:hypothetical protein BGZ47_010724 [Haplosporangium gracile]|nr:hypothetical protein BGZ47_010724 [Haplosporangium gracile]
MTVGAADRTFYRGDIVVGADAGAMIAIRDAAALANVLFGLLSSPSVMDLETAFSEYRSEHHPAAKKSYNNRLMLSKPIKRSFVSALTRFFMKYRPE